MNLFTKIFGTGKVSQHSPSIQFGRYDESYKGEDRDEAWDESLGLFAEKKYLEAYLRFFDYLNNSNSDNIQIEKKDDAIFFKVQQGSKLIRGMANAEKFKAEAKVARMSKREKRVLKRLLYRNFDLKYSRYALTPEDEITIFFDTYTIDGSPYKLYYALKELAVNADKMDDLLLDEFDFIEPIDEKTIQDIPEREKKVKFDFIRQEINSVLYEIEHGPLNPSHYPAGISYLLLNLCYKLDYLIRPEGTMMETLERIHRKYFAMDEQFSEDKNREMMEEFRGLLDRSKEDFFKELYIVTSTFSITTPVDQERVDALVQGELGNMDWYIENGYGAVALSIPGYVIGYTLFNFSILAPIRSLFHLYYQVYHQNFLNQLGYKLNFREGEKLDRRRIKKAVKQIETEYKHRYPSLVFETERLDFSNLTQFSRSFLKMVISANLGEVKK